MNCVYDQPVLICTDRDGGRRIELGLSNPTSRCYYFKRVLMERKIVELSCRAL